MSKIIDRTIEIIHILAENAMTLKEIASEFNISVRTARRDIKRIRQWNESGIKIKWITDNTGSYPVYEVKNPEVFIYERN